MSYKKLSSKILIHFIVGARPNFIKLNCLLKLFKKNKKFQTKVIHTGQHNLKNMSNVFFKSFNISDCDSYFKYKSNTYSQMMSSIMTKYERLIKLQKPNIVVVFGDVNSTLACALVAKNNNVPIAHVEAGLRSNDLSMPEEVNRKLVDSISDYLFTPSLDANNNLISEGINNKKISFVGNVMIDTIMTFEKNIKNSKILKKFNLKKNEYCLVTFHRPENVDNKKKFENIINIIKNLSSNIDFVFPVHPRTKNNFSKFINKISNLEDNNILFCDPLDYFQIQKLIKEARIIITDSGGIQEESTHYNIPCLTFRKNTERPITIKQGSNILVNEKNINKIFLKEFKQKRKTRKKIPNWDGKASLRIYKYLNEKFA
jgi:UDP-N-acetylglucosamine 2-epimerase (non-hydrolysing)